MLLEKKKKEKNKISEVSTFSILPYTQNRKLGNLGKFSFTSNFDRFTEIFHIFPENPIEVPQVVHKMWTINLFINVSGFLTFPCYKEINDVNI